jgi:4-aminobutyrate aminotransferase/(S)-3-amino-2-methylpropionate transaminase
MVAVELVRNRATKEPAKEETQQIVRDAYEHGVLLIAAGTFGNVIRFLAPLVISDDELDEALDVMTSSFAGVVAHTTA